ncbi:MAG TPA: hypothetical protein VM389_14295 [Phycisphaerae bacterium]|nr:hypothetical protein [Phycisphaerae bacterium]
MQYDLWLKWLLRLGGGVSCLALPAVFLPLSWMAACHEWLGLGPLPQGAIVPYLARSLSAFYAFFGGLCVLVSFDVRRHRPTITYIAVTHVAFAAGVAVIDLTAGLPWYWIAAEAPAALAFGAAILLLQAAARGD